MSSSPGTRGGVARGALPPRLGSWRLWVIASAIVALVFGLIGSSGSFQGCIKARKAHQAYSALHEERPLFVKAIVRLGLHATCARFTAGENDGAIVAIGTLVLAFFTFALWRSTDKLWIAADQQRSDMLRVIKASEDAATAANSQAEVARESFIATHRPRLRIRNIAPHQSESIHGARQHWLTGGSRIGGQLYVVNVGDSDAILTEYLIVVYPTKDELPPERPYEGKRGIKVDVGFLAGQSQPLTFSFDGEIDAKTADAIRGGASSAHKLYVMGWVEYRDLTYTPRRTAFCRMYSPATGRFRAIDDPDYEHEE